MQRKRLNIRETSEHLHTLMRCFSSLFHCSDERGRSLLHIVAPIIYDSSFNTCRAKRWNNWGRHKTTHFKSKSRPTNCLCCGRSIYAFTAKNVPTQLSITRPPGRVNLRMMSTIHDMFFCIGQSKALEPDVVERAWKIGSPWRRHESLDIWFIHPKFVNFMSPGAW